MIALQSDLFILKSFRGTESLLFEWQMIGRCFNFSSTASKVKDTLFHALKLLSHNCTINLWVFSQSMFHKVENVKSDFKN